MKTHWSRSVAAVLGLAVGVLGGPAVAADEVVLVGWNMQVEVGEAVKSRQADFEALAKALKPDVVVLVELADGPQAELVAKWLGWESYYGVASDWGKHNPRSPYLALETAVISKVPIKQVIEYDASPDKYHEVFTEAGPLQGRVQEAQLQSAGDGVFGTVAGTDRGTMRVDLANGLSIFPLHLKSNRNNSCMKINGRVRSARREGHVPEELLRKQTEGFPAATEEHKENAEKRERVMAATARLGAAATQDGRVAVIIGDLNTAFEPGKVGIEEGDCKLQNFSCVAGPFPQSACADGDGFDDTLGMLTAGLIDGQRWVVLTENIGRTYQDKVYADHAIDHFAVPAAWAGRFTSTAKAQDTFGSDHFPIRTVYSTGP